MRKLLLLINLALLVSGQPAQLTPEQRELINTVSRQWNAMTDLSDLLVKSIYNCAMGLWYKYDEEPEVFLKTPDNGWQFLKTGEYGWQVIIAKNIDGSIEVENLSIEDYDSSEVCMGYRSQSSPGDDVLVFIANERPDGRWDGTGTGRKGKHIRGSYWEGEFLIRFDNGEEKWVHHGAVFKYIDVKPPFLINI